MKFKHKVYDHNRKVGINFGSFGPNSLVIRNSKGQNLTLFDFIKKLIIVFFLYANLTVYLDS